MISRKGVLAAVGVLTMMWSVVARADWYEQGVGYGQGLRSVAEAGCSEQTEMSFEDCMVQQRLSVIAQMAEGYGYYLAIANSSPDWYANGCAEWGLPNCE